MAYERDFTEKEHNVASEAPGVTADMNAEVKIGLVHGGYFSSPERAKEFIDLWFERLRPELPQHLRYADFGCGDGFLANVVTGYLEANGYSVVTDLIDGNPTYLKECEKTGYSRVLADLKDYVATIPYDLISMRAVNHYNSLADQEVILTQARKNLCDQGFLINQLSSGTDENCKLRTELVNLPTLIYGGKGKNYHWTSISEYIPLADRAGFTKTDLVGYAQANAWKPEDQWERMNGVLLKKAEERDDRTLLQTLQIHRNTYLAQANALIASYVDTYGTTLLDVEDVGDSYSVRYQYPVFVSKK